jgi:archaellum component FlaG (FlaF/FlaG flagellin family)
MAVIVLFVVALMVAAAVWAALPRLQDEPVRVRISEHPRRNSRR